ncbi:tRNA epoxyqueuosine(34) reductase QueG [Marinobacter lutaoensis]|jgi:epoxyqueuosine reductase|uniref:Epoxyqueuosine reductase n=1 Tax=Marinobacter lutaoensis TaxID=135739 RepID=A0A1V2DVX2_9GAMM|nr:tRNA epoxyqueuosine(34) reductase QueG [Marinobacter lutaoensis]NVD34901.1 tRNA epoxyqueuosine(34) reductase QueG [Marinobacter lutaoensis]ONF44935.1 tRNA epoxyqueuosine(34) reductase QueG [Marinobacter lutaoensis]
MTDRDSAPVRDSQLQELKREIRAWARELGFSDVGVTRADTGPHGERLRQWLAKGYHGEMTYMAQHGDKRYTPTSLVPGTVRVLSVRMDYLPAPDSPKQVLTNRERAYISRYTLGRDYHKLLRKRLATLARRIDEALQGFDYRAFVDSAPVLERALAQRAGLGWIGKNTMLIHPKAGSFFFLGEIFTSAPLPEDAPFERDHCGRCSACLDVCPTDAFVAPHLLDARRCISYLTIELKGPIPEALRPKLGNRVFGCDDCQLVCPWNRFSRPTAEPDFQPRHGLDNATLAELFLWSEEEFLARTEGSAIRRTGYQGWLRNLAVGLGNAPTTIPVVEALRRRADHPSELVREHVHWALRRHGLTP